MPSHRNRIREVLGWLSTYPQEPDIIISAPHCLKAAVLPLGLALQVFIWNTKHALGNSSVPRPHCIVSSNVSLSLEHSYLIMANGINY